MLATPQRHRPIKTYAVLILIASILPMGCKRNDEVVPDTGVTVQVQHPDRGPIAEEITADAVLAPLSQAALSPRISSTIKAEYVQRGAHVRSGELLVTLEDRDLQGSALDSKGSLVSAEAAYVTATEATIPEDAQKAELDVAQARANLSVATQAAVDRKHLFEQGALPGRDADIAAASKVQAQAAYDTAVKRLASLVKTTRDASARAVQGQLNSAKGRYMSAEAQVGYANLRSPINGVVTDRPLFPGEMAVAGTPVITVMDTSALLAKLHITQASAQALRVGGTARIIIPGVADPVDATVSFVSPAVDAGSATVEVWLKLANADGRYKVGTAVHAAIRGTTIADALQVPPTALLPAQDGSTNVMVVGSDNAAHARAVKVGIRSGARVQIVDGLAPADTVIVEGSYGLDDGTKVSPSEGKGSGEDRN
jgi:multidrug efflux pump subunit AcrA (membrane-fusion protein)